MLMYGAARSPAVAVSTLFFLLFSCQGGGGKGAQGRTEGRGSLPRKHTSDETVRIQRERLVASARPSKPGRTQHSFSRNQTSRGVVDVENDADAVGSGAENGRRAARLREGLRRDFLEEKEEEDDIDFEFDRFDDGYDDWSDEDSEGWSDQEDSEESSQRQGWRWGSKKSGTQGSAETTVVSVRDRLNNARRRASRAYREAKSFMSSEMEGVVLKATRPDNLPVKPKHLESLMRPTAEMPKEFNVYLPVVRKLWAKMTDREWQVAVKALYVIHRFAANGNIDHAVNLKESVAVLRSHHDSRRKVNYFDMGAICDVKAPPWSGEDITPFAEFLRAYAEYVLYRTTQFGPGFEELLGEYAMMVGDVEMISVVVELVAMGLKCGVLREEQESAATVEAAMLAAKDVRDVVEICSAQLDYLAREGQARTVYPAEVDRWYVFLRENHESVATLIVKANELAAKHNLTLLRPLAMTPMVLELRDKELDEKEKAVSTEGQCSVDEMEALGVSSDEDASTGLSMDTSDRTQKPSETVDEENHGEEQEPPLTSLSARAAGGSSTASGSRNRIAGKQASAGHEGYVHVSRPPGGAPRMASQKQGEENGDMRRRGDVDGRRKADMSMVKTGGALSRSSATVKAQTRKKKGDGGVQAQTKGDSVVKRDRDGDGDARRTKARRMVEGSSIERLKKASPSRVTGLGSCSSNRRDPEVRHAVKHQGTGTESAQVGSFGTKTPSSMRKHGVRPSSTKSGTVRKAMEGGKTATVAARSVMEGVNRRGSTNGGSHKSRERENPALGHGGEGLHSSPSPPGKRMKRNASSAKASKSTDY